MDLIDDPIPGENAHDFTVSEISGAVKRVLEGEFGRVRIRGEVGRVFPARSGHLYFDLKDARSVLAAVSWKGQVSRLTVRPEEGMEVVATGRLTTFGSQSKYQLTVEDIRPAGVGALMAMLEKRKKALEAEGLFAAERKRPLPFLPEVIGVVTSPGGAVIRDILHRLRERFPRRVLVWPVAVQGERCAPEVARAIAGFNALPVLGPVPRPDLLIVARGGGSVEDLWGFNEESVARAAAGSEIPLISAVGHETDTTLIDYVSDRRAPTPTAAAELAVPVRLELLSWLEGQNARLAGALARAVKTRQTRLADLARALPRPEALTASARQRLDYLDERLPGALRAAAQAKRLTLAEITGAVRLGLLRERIGERRRALGQVSGRLGPAVSGAARGARRGFDALAGRLRPETLARRSQDARGRFDALSARLSIAAQAQTLGWRQKLAGLERLRGTLGYQATLSRGYAVVRGADGGVLTTKVAAERATGLEIEFADGRHRVGGEAAGAAEGAAQEKTPKTPAKTPATSPAKKRAKKPPGTPPEQGSLF